MWCDDAQVELRGARKDAEPVRDAHDDVAAALLDHRGGDGFARVVAVPIAQVDGRLIDVGGLDEDRTSAELDHQSRRGGGWKAVHGVLLVSGPSPTGADRASVDPPLVR